MDEACATTIGGMAAMIGGLENDVRQLAADEDVDVANINALGQIVISGELAKVEAAVSVGKGYSICLATLTKADRAEHSCFQLTTFEKVGSALIHIVMQPPQFYMSWNVA